jgi:hypothetical protein
VKECKTLFDKAFGAKFRESTIFEDVSMEHRKLLSTPHDLSPLVNTSQVSLRAHIAHAGVTYSRSSTHLGNSLVLYYAAGDVSKPPVAGSIKYIYTEGNVVRLAIQRQIYAPAGTTNPFARYLDFPASVYSTSMSIELEMVELIWLAGHYARWAMSEDLCVVLALLKVRLMRLFRLQCTLTFALQD